MPLPGDPGPDPPEAALPAALASEDAVLVDALDEIPSLGRAMGRGFAWSLLNNFVGKLGSFLVGIAVVRILSPDQFGSYAVGLVVLTVLLSVNELGVSVAVVQRPGSVSDIAPTVVTISILSSAVLGAAAFVLAPVVASAMQAPDATWLIRLLIIGVLVDGVVAVPNALITRAMEQRKRLLIDTIAFLVGTPVTIALALAGFGGWSLGWGAVVGNLVSGLLAYLWAPARYRPGWRRDVLPELLRFGLPLAGSSLLLFLMLNLDYVVVGHMFGPVQLGLYLLAFNVASWPTTVIGTAIRRVTLAAFSRMSENEADGGSVGFSRVAGLMMAVTLPVCALLSLYAAPIIDTLYGARWSGAVGVLELLVVFSAGRVAVELTYDFLAATGRTGFTVWLHAAWLVALVPSLIVGGHLGGIRGVAGGHAVVVLAVVLPLLGYLLGRADVRLRTLALYNLRPVVGLIVLAVPVLVCLHQDWPLVVSVASGSFLGLVGYAAVVWPMRRSALALWNMSH